MASDVGMATHTPFAGDLLQIGVDSSVVMMAVSARFDLVGDLLGMVARGGVASDAFLLGKRSRGCRPASQPLTQGFTAARMRVQRRAGNMAGVAAIIPRSMGERHMAR
jgi:hypothetical protein